MLSGDKGGHQVNSLIVTVDSEDEDHEVIRGQDQSSILDKPPEAKSTLVNYSPQREDYLQQLQTFSQLLLKTSSDIRLVGFFQIDTGSIVCQLFANDCEDGGVKRELEDILRELKDIPSIYSQDYFNGMNQSQIFEALQSIVGSSQALSTDTFSEFFFQIQDDRIYTFCDPELSSYLSYKANYPNVSYSRSFLSPEIVARAEVQKKYTDILCGFISELRNFNAPVNVDNLNRAHIQYCEKVSSSLGGRMEFLKLTPPKDAPVVIQADNAGIIAASAIAFNEAPPNVGNRLNPLPDLSIMPEPSPCNWTGLLKILAWIGTTGIASLLLLGDAFKLATVVGISSSVAPIAVPVAVPIVVGGALLGGYFFLKRCISSDPPLSARNAGQSLISGVKG